MSYNPVWEAARNGLSTDLDAVNHANQLNQLLTSHNVFALFEGNRVLNPGGGTNFFQDFTGNGNDFSQPFVMSGTTIGRVSMPVFANNNGADFTITLCPDVSGSPNLNNVLAQTVVPAAWTTNLTNQYGIPSGTNTLVVPQNQTMTGTQNITTNVPWAGTTVDGSGVALGNNSMTTSGNYFISAGGYTSAVSGAVFTAQFTGTGQIANPVLQPSLPQGGYFGMVAATTSSLVYAGGNIANGGTTLTANTYTASWDPLTGQVGTWSQQAALPVAIQHASAAASGNTVYILGGADGSNNIQNAVYYATVNNGQITSWTKSMPLPTPLQQSAVTVLNGWIIVAGGSTTGGSTTASNLVYYSRINSDGSLVGWVRGPNLPTALATWAPGWNFVTTDSGFHTIGGIATGGGGIFTLQLQSLSITANGIGDYWKTTGLGSIGGAQMASAFPMGNGKWNVILPFIGNPSNYAWTVLTPLPLMSIPLYATPLTNGATYHIVYQEHQYQTSSDYLSIGLTNGAYPSDALTKSRSGSTWTVAFAGQSIPMVIYDNSTGGKIIHTFEDPTSTGSAAFSNMATRTSSYMYNSYNLPIGYAEATTLPNEPLNKNPTFTTGVSSWTPHNCTFVQDGSVVQGNFPFSGKMTPNGVASAPNVTSELIPIQQAPISFRPVQVFQANGWFYSPTGWGNVSLSIDWYDPTQTYITTSNSTTSLPAASWTNLVMRYNPPSNASYASLNFIEAGTPAATNTVFFSNVFLVFSSERTVCVAPIAQINYDTTATTAAAAGIPWPPTGVTQLN